MAYTTTWEIHGLIWRHSGEMTDEDALQSNEAFYSDARSLFTKYQIVDFTRVTDVQVTPEAVREIARRDAIKYSENPNIRVAFVTSSEIFKRFVELYEQSSGSASWESEVFESEETAREWLGEFALDQQQPLFEE